MTALRIDAVQAALQRDGRLDANESLFFARQLEAISSRVFKVKRPALSAMEVFPIDTSVPAWATTHTYYMYDSTGMAKIIANYADDLPNVSLSAKKQTYDLHSLGAAFYYSVADVRAASRTGLPLQSELVATTRKAHEITANKIAWFGDSAANLPGFLTNSNIPAYTIPADGNSNGGSSSKKFQHKTPDQILRDLNGIANSIPGATFGIHRPNDLLIDQDNYSLISSTPRSATSDTTILDFFLANNPYIQNVRAVNELKDAGGAGVNYIVAGEFNEENVAMVIPMMMQMEAPQPDNLSFKVPTESRVGGVTVRYPLAFAIGSGV